MLFPWLEINPVVGAFNTVKIALSLLALQPLNPPSTYIVSLFVSKAELRVLFADAGP